MLRVTLAEDKANKHTNTHLVSYHRSFSRKTDYYEGMSYPAERNRRRGTRDDRINRVMISRRRRQGHEMFDGIFRDPLLDSHHNYLHSAIRNSSSPRGHVELMDMRDDTAMMGGGGYRPPALDDNLLPVVQGLVVVQRQQHQNHHRQYQNHTPTASYTLSSGLYHNPSPLVNANPAEDLSIPCISHGCFCMQCVRTQEVGFLENFGDFQEILGPGLYCLCWPWSGISKRLSLRVQQLDVETEVNTADKVFCRIQLTLLFRVSPIHAYEACYALQDPTGTIESLVLDILRSTIPTIQLDGLFQSRDDVVDAVFGKVHRPLREYGYELCSVLMTHISPHASVRDALNEVPAATRWKQAAVHRGEAIRVERIKHAEAAAERTHLLGIGIARSRQAVAKSLRESTQSWMDDVYVRGPTHRQIMSLLLMTQYFDVLMGLPAQRMVMPVT